MIENLDRAADLLKEAAELIDREDVRIILPDDGTKQIFVPRSDLGWLKIDLEKKADQLKERSQKPPVGPEYLAER